MKRSYLFFTVTSRISRLAAISKSLSSLALPTVVVVFSMWSLSPQAEAQTTYTWTGTNGSDWGTSANWNPNSGVPGSFGSLDDVAEFTAPGSSNPTVNNFVARTLSQIVIDPGTLYTITNFGDIVLVGPGISDTIGSGLIVNSGGGIYFIGNSTAGSGTISNSAGLIYFGGNSTADSATINNDANGTIDISALTSTGISIGEVSGVGNISLGAKNLSLGGLNTDDTISGVISGAGGSLTQTGTGTLTLTGINTYSGNTTINSGILAVNGSTASSPLTTIGASGMLEGTGTVGSVINNGILMG